MPQQPFRLVHSSDWELQRPLLGWSSAPEALRERLLEAPFVAAERVVETAVREQANFLLLTGGLAPLEEADARTIQFLAAQFERLARERIDVYWVGGPQDPPAAWPSGLPLPSNVHAFGQQASYPGFATMGIAENANVAVGKHGRGQQD